MKLSEELKHCLDDDACGTCQYYSTENHTTCRGLLQKAYEKIKKYEDLEEQRKLHIFPCCVGDIVYRINKGAEQPVIPLQVINFRVFNNDLIQDFKMECVDKWDGIYMYNKIDIGSCVFLKKREAETSLRKMGG